jgi:large repetitive protein
MRTLLLILLFLSGFAFAQPSINNPTPLKACDGGNDGIEPFNLFSKNAEILGSLNALNHTVSYHETLAFAQNNISPLSAIYNNIINNQSIYVRVIENSNPTLYSTTTLTLEAVPFPTPDTIADVTACDSYTLPSLSVGQNYYTQPFGTGTLIAAGTEITTTQTIYIFAESGTIPNCTSESSFTVTVNPSPSIAQPSNLVENDSDGMAVFNLTMQTSALLNGNPNLTVAYFTSLADAESGTGNIVNAATYVNTSNPQTIYVRVSDNLTGCFSITNFDLIVNINPFAINNPTPLQVCDDNNDTFGVFDLTTKVSEILGVLNPSDYSVAFHSSLASAQANTNAITNVTSYVNTLIYTQTIGVRVTNTTNGEYAVTTLDLIVNPSPSILQPPNLVENDTDGTAVFNLASQTPTIVGSLTDWENGYFLSFEDAQNYTNFIPNPGTFTNTSNPQTIYCGVRSLWTNCVSVTNFDLIVNTNPFAINNPTPLQVCDSDNDGAASFDLTLKNSEILGALNPLDYTVSYHETATDAQTGSNLLVSPYSNVSPFNQTIYVRVTENTNPTTFSTTTLTLEAVSYPSITPILFVKVILYLLYHLVKIIILSLLAQEHY